MKKLIIVLAAVALCIPAAALGGKPAKKPPTRASILAAKNAAWACKALRMRMGAQAFVATYGTNTRAHGAGAMRNAFGKCVSQQVRLIRRAGLFEPATGTLTITPPTAPSTTEALALTATISGGRPIASGSVSGTFSVDLAAAVTKHGVTCAPVTGTLTLTQASPAGTLVKTLTTATFCKGAAGSALVGRYSLTGTGAFAGKTGTGTELLLASATGSAHSVEFGSIG
ncbi:MAG TPA: hypothetical protein VE596_08910 [Gaiellaceae bacterium]|jgi:hypothetical protein|nr:hypothetical protein [Gaiellaceae bacterium]